ncbi:MAG: TonB-dependent receptor [Ramlibacter sp.]|nr:TonB-dependent receptor [Ramlibacter sp.]
MKSIFRCSAAGAALFSLGHVLAQTTAPSASLQEVTVTGNPLGATDLIVPAASYSGTGLLLRRGDTLGETLDGTPGVSSTYFGPNANRPVIRGLDGDRIRILANGGASVDASGLSYDHAVPADPISIERIEVLRGPGALLYGGSAVGGVVNVIDNRIPREPLEGVVGKADLGLSSGNAGRGAGVLVEGGNDRIGLHADMFDRRTSDVRVPVSLACTQGGGLALARRICNSASNVRGGAVGASLFFDRGYVGASASSYRNDYGTVAEDDVTIGMQSQRYALEALLRHPVGWLESFKGQASYTRYQHTEFEGGAPGTVFGNAGNDYRLEARHVKWGALEGVWGVQGESTRFSAVGEEAFAPFSRTRQDAVFMHEELATGWGRLSFGARSERVRVDAMGNPDVARFVPGSRDFKPFSTALGALWKLAPAWQLTAQWARSERAPKDYELFADGPHVATGAWERGDATLAKERSNNLDLGLQWTRGPHRAKFNVYRTRFANYIGLEATGASEDGLPVLAYRQVPARFTGMEASGTVRLFDTGSTLDLEWRGDLLRATNLANGQPLPRVAPARVGATLVWTRGDWGARLGMDHLAAQRRVPAGEQASAAYTLWNAALTWRTRLGPSHLLWFVRLDNATDRLAYSATSILTQTAPGKSPLPGRSVKLGLQATF